MIGTSMQPTAQLSGVWKDGSVQTNPADDSVVTDLVEDAKKHKTPRVKQAVKDAIDEKKAANAPAPETNPLKIALAQQTMLLQQKATYEHALEIVNQKLGELDKEIAKLSG